MVFGSAEALVHRLSILARSKKSEGVGLDWLAARDKLQPLRGGTIVHKKAYEEKLFFGTLATKLRIFTFYIRGAPAIFGRRRQVGMRYHEDTMERQQLRDL